MLLAQGPHFGNHQSDLKASATALQLLKEELPVPRATVPGWQRVEGVLGLPPLAPPAPSLLAACAEAQGTRWEA